MSKANRTRNELSVCGYVRENFAKKCWIDEIVATIVEFYEEKGGSLYVMGDGQYGRLGIEKYKNDLCRKPTLCPPFNNNNAFRVSAGQSHTLILDTNYEVWCCGSGERGQLGTGKTNDLHIPQILNLAFRVISISTGHFHSLLLCENRWVYSFGSNVNGQIGHSNLKNYMIPTPIEALKKYKIAQISAKLQHSAALTEDGDLFCFGWNFYGQCGVGKGKGFDITVPTKVALDEKIAFVDCGAWHTLLLTRKDLIYAFGSGSDGRLGNGPCGKTYTPTLIESLKSMNIKTCSAGGAHSLCIGKEGNIWKFGRRIGTCGCLDSEYCSDSDDDFDDDSRGSPQIIEWFTANNIKGKQCIAGVCQSCIISECGILYVFGCNDDHTLGLEEEAFYFTPTTIPEIISSVKCVSMGFSHTAVICH